MSKEKHILNVEERTSFGSGASRRLRNHGKIPAIIYGHGSDPKTFLLDGKEWKILAQEDVHLVELKPSKGTIINALVKEVQFDYLKGTTLHVDFQEVKMDEIITTSVPIYTRGTPVGFSQGGVLDQLLYEIEIKCLPKDLPESIEIDVSGLELEGSLQVKDLKLPDNVSAVNDPEETVVHVLKSRLEIEEPKKEEGEGLPEGEGEGEEEKGEGEGEEVETVDEKQGKKSEQREQR